MLFCDDSMLLTLQMPMTLRAPQPTMRLGEAWLQVHAKLDSTNDIARQHACDVLKGLLWLSVVSVMARVASSWAACQMQTFTDL